MRIRILGSAAGGGLPQWNCRCPNCDAARAGSPDVQPRTQSSVAVSADGSDWFLLNVSADVRHQVLGHEGFFLFKRDLEEMAVLKKSLMPENHAEQLTVKQLHDLFSFLMTLD